jgi:hypothetical protein
MFKIAALLWIVLGASLAGIGLMIVVATPSLAAQDMKLIPWAALAGFVVAMPISWVLAGQIARVRR